MKNLILTVTALLFTMSVSAQTVVDAAVSNKDFSTLVTALKAADLVGALSGKGPFTVFAPNNEAFSKIDAGTLGDLLKPENVKALSNILTYHVVSGKLMASDVANALKSGNGKVDLKALNGQTITAISKDGSSSNLKLYFFYFCFFTFRLVLICNCPSWTFRCITKIFLII